MTTNVFGQRLHAHIHAEGKGVEQNARCIRVVQSYGNISCMPGCYDARNILHIHRDRSWALTPDERCLGPNKLVDLASYHRVISFDLDVVSTQKSISQFSVRTISSGWEKDVASSLAEGQIDKRDGGKAAGGDKSMQRTFQLSNTAPKLQSRRCPEGAIGVSMLDLPPIVGNLGLGFEYHSGAAVCGRGE